MFVLTVENEPCLNLLNWIYVAWIDGRNVHVDIVITVNGQVVWIQCVL